MQRQHMELIAAVELASAVFLVATPYVLVLMRLAQKLPL